MDTFLQFALLAVSGVLIGILSGMLGIGGGTIMVPLFRLLFGMSPLMSTATSFFAIIPTSLSGAIAHIRAKTMFPALGVVLGIGGAMTSPVGVWLASISPSWAVMLAAALVIGYSAANMLVKAARMKPDKKKQSGAISTKNEDFGTVHEAALAGIEVIEVAKTDNEDAGAKSNEKDNSPINQEQGMKLDRRKIISGIVMGLFAGLISGYVGVGGGFIMVPFMISFLGVPMKYASGTSLLAVMILVIPGVIGHAMMGNINYLAGIIMALGSIPGAIVGARFVRIIPERILRFMFGGFLIVGAILLAINEIQI